jgi:hypothetical protein
MLSQGLPRRQFPASPSARRSATQPVGPARQGPSHKPCGSGQQCSTYGSFPDLYAAPDGSLYLKAGSSVTNIVAPWPRSAVSWGTSPNTPTSGLSCSSFYGPTSASSTTLSAASGGYITL